MAGLLCQCVLDSLLGKVIDALMNAVQHRCHLLNDNLKTAVHSATTEGH